MLLRNIKQKHEKIIFSLSYYVILRYNNVYFYYYNDKKQIKFFYYMVFKITEIARMVAVFFFYSSIYIKNMNFLYTLLKLFSIHLIFLGTVQRQ